MFGFNFRKKEVFPPLPDESTDKNITEEVPLKEERKPKTIQDIDQARKDIYDLQDKREGKLNDIRRQKQLLKELGVKEFEKNSSKRTQTFKENMSPLEKELEEISNEITQIRNEHDLDPTRQQVLESRIKRLEDLKKNEEESFFKTVIGGNIKSMEDEIARLEKEKEPNIHNSAKLNDVMRNISEIEAKINRLYSDNKEAYLYATTVDKIDHLIADNSSNLRDSKDSEKDENGFMTVGKKANSR